MIGKKVEVIEKMMSNLITEAVYYQHSILIFDDIESITGSGQSTDENTPDSTNASRYFNFFLFFDFFNNLLM